MSVFGIFGFLSGLPFFLDDQPIFFESLLESLIVPKSPNLNREGSP
jgi:hypothetical protein